MAERQSEGMDVDAGPVDDAVANGALQQVVHTDRLTDLRHVSSTLSLVIAHLPILADVRALRGTCVPLRDFMKEPVVPLAWRWRQRRLELFRNLARMEEVLSNALVDVNQPDDLGNTALIALMLLDRPPDQQAAGHVQQAAGVAQQVPGPTQQALGPFPQPPGFFPLAPGLAQLAPGFFQPAPGLFPHVPAPIQLAPGPAQQPPNPAQLAPLPFQLAPGGALQQALIQQAIVSVLAQQALAHQQPPSHVPPLDAAALLLRMRAHDIDVNARDACGCAALAHACKRGLVEMVALLLAHPSIDVNQRDGSSRAWRTPLMAALEGWRADVAALLLEHPALDINAVDSDGRCALAYAAARGMDEIVRLILQCPGVDDAITDSLDVFPLVAALGNGRGGAARAILERRGNALNTTLTMQSLGLPTDVLVAACRDGNAGVVQQILLQPGLDVNLQADSEGERPIFVALKQRPPQLPIASLLLRHPSMDGSASNAAGSSLLHVVHQRPEQLVRQVLEVPRTDVNARDADGHRVLTLWAKTGSTYLSLLLGHPDINVRAADTDGAFPLIWACRAGMERAVAALLEVPGIDINQEARPPSIEPYAVPLRHERPPPPPAQFFAGPGAPPVLIPVPQPAAAQRARCAAPPAPPPPFRAGTRPLIDAAEQRHEGVLRLLLQHPAIQVNAGDADGATALLHACMPAWRTRTRPPPYMADPPHPPPLAVAPAAAQPASIVSALLAAPGVDAQLPSRHGLTPLRAAIESRDAAVVCMLLDHLGLDVNGLGLPALPAGTPLLVHAAGDRNAQNAGQPGSEWDLAPLLQRPGINVNATDTAGRSALIVACKDIGAAHGHVERLLACPGLDVNMRDHSGVSALQAAVQAVKPRLGRQAHMPPSQPMQALASLLRHPAMSSSLIDACVYLAARPDVAAFPAVIDELLQLGFDFNAPDASGDTPLIHAIVHGMHAFAVELVQHEGVAVTPKHLLLALKHGHRTLSSVLVDKAAPNWDLASARDSDGGTALLYASQNGLLSVIERVLPISSVSVTHIKRTDGFGVSPLQAAIKAGDVEAATKLLLHPSNRAKVLEACRALADLPTDAPKAAELLQVLLLPGVDVNARDERGDTPFVWACRLRKLAVLQLLLQREDLDVNLPGLGGRTGLMAAAQNGYEDVVDLLLNLPALDPSARDTEGASALALACAEGHEAVVERLLRHPAVAVSAPPLLAALEAGKAGAALLLLRHAGVDTSGTPEPDALAAVPLVQELLLQSSGLDLNRPDAAGRTPLLASLAAGAHSVVAVLLLLSGVDVNAVSQPSGGEGDGDGDGAPEGGGETALAYCCRTGTGMAAALPLLLRHPRIDVNVRDAVTGRTPLMTLLQRRHEAAAQLLLGHPLLDVNATDEEGQNALFYAARRGLEGVVGWLLERPEVDVGLRDSDGRTAAEVARENGHDGVAAALEARLAAA